MKETKQERCVVSQRYALVILTTSVQIILDPKTSRKIFELARDQQEELNEDEEDEDKEEDSRANFSIPRGHTGEDDEEDDDLGDYDEDEEEIEEIVRLDSTALVM